MTDSNQPSAAPTLLVGVDFGLPHFDEGLVELGLLAESGGLQPVARLTCKRKAPDPALFVGSGKADEIKELATLHGAREVLFDQALSPAQQRNLERHIGLPVNDRTLLILEIFAQRARSHEGKLQVELARLQYLSTRLVRRWSHLERQRGGIGVRGGAGEKQIDVDRHLLRQRISSITKDLKRIEAHKEREVSARPDLFTVALVGYTNAGKSSMMNRLTSAGVLAENKLFSTLDTRTRPWRLSGGRTILLTDTVGFIRKLPHQLVASFHATLQEALNADLLLVLVDGSSPEAAEQLRTVHEVLDQLGSGDLPRLTVVNKLDLVKDRSMLHGIYQMDPRAVAVSVHSGEGIEQLLASMQEHLASVENRVEILLPHRAGGLRAEIRAKATVLSEFFTEAGCLMEIQASPALLGRLLAEGASIADPSDRPQPEA